MPYKEKQQNIYRTKYVITKKRATQKTGKGTTLSHIICFWKMVIFATTGMKM
jgi:hypothetical protein